MVEERVFRFVNRVRQFHPTSHPQPRAMALFAGAIVLADADCLTMSLQAGRQAGLSRTIFYELILQSYLFLGFPRMLLAMDHLNKEWAHSTISESMLAPISASEGQKWHDDGIRLCEQVYQQNYPALKQRVEAMAPEIFRWMILEGYGKVLSRPDIPIAERELAIVAMLMIEQREAQLHSHIKGALNVGVDFMLLEAVVEDIGDAAGRGYDMAKQILTKVGSK